MKVSPKVSNKTLLIVSLTVFLDMLGFGILVPMVPLLIVNPHIAQSVLDASVSIQTRYILLGILIALFPLTQLFATPVLGDISDSIGRKKVLLFSIVGTAFSYFLMIVGVETRSIAFLLIARALDGISGGNLSVAQAAIADISTNSTRARNFAFLSAAFGLGFVMGPVMGTHLQRSVWGLSTPFFVAFVLSLINIFVVYAFMTETRQKTALKKGVRLDRAFTHIKSALSMKGIRLFFAVNFFLQGSFAIFTAFLSVFVFERSSLSESQFGFVLSYLGIWMVVGQIALTKLFAIKLGELRAFYICLLGLSLSTVSLLTAHGFVSFLIITPFISIFLGLSQAFLLSLLSASVRSAEQGEILGINTSVTALAQTIPPILGGLAAAAFSPTTPILFAAGSTFIASLIVRRRVKFSLNTV